MQCTNDDSCHSWNHHTKAQDASLIDSDPGMQQLSQPPTTTAVMERWTAHRTNDSPRSRNPHIKAKDTIWIVGDPGMQQLSQPPTTTAIMERWTTHLTNDDPHSRNPQGTRRVID